jgi:hypothetical protein
VNDDVCHLAGEALFGRSGDTPVVRYPGIESAQIGWNAMQGDGECCCAAKDASVGKSWSAAAGMNRAKPN